MRTVLLPVRMVQPTLHVGVVVTILFEWQLCLHALCAAFAQGGNGGEVLDLEEGDVPAASSVVAPAASGVSSGLRVKLSRTLVCCVGVHLFMDYRLSLPPLARVGFTSLSVLLLFALTRAYVNRL